MGILRTALEVIGLFILLFVIMPIILALFGLMTGFWYGIYVATLHSLGPSNPLTVITYYVYELSKWASAVTQYGFNIKANTAGGGDGGACA